MSFIRNWLWFFVFFSIATYPIAGIRILGMPYPVFFIAISLPFLFLFKLNKKKQIKITKIKLELFSVLSSYIFLSLIINIFTKSSSDYLVSQFVYPLVCLLIFIFIEQKSIPYAVNALYFSSLVLLFYGLYGFITWNTGDIIQHTFGYFGITYLESTRNGDLVYLFPGLIISYVYGNNSSSKIIAWFNRILCLIFLIAILANFSRGGIIALFILAIMIIRRKKKQSGKLPIMHIISIIFAFFFLFLLFSNFVDKIYFDIIYYRISSIFSLNSDRDVSYNSNSDRLAILQTSIGIFKNHVLGVGITGMRDITNGELFHSENAYFSILVYYGLPGILLFLFILWTIKKIVFFEKVLINMYNQINSFLFIFLVVYSLFNMMIDLLPFWMILGLATSSIQLNQIAIDDD